ncbi:MAG TPA: hypothetical protein VM529_14155, partial [Gemmata sp.]|nr:hypothetical protein [Gemmata sp.]
MVASAPCPSPRQLVSPLLVRGTLHYPRVGCQYRGVYRKRGRWRATVKLTWRGGGEHRRAMHHLAGPDGRKVFDSPLDAARALAAFWAHWLGPDWGWLIANHRKHVWRYAPWRVRYVVRRDREPDGPFAGEPRLFPTWEAARAEVHPWLARTFGADGVARLWRPRP